MRTNLDSIDQLLMCINKSQTENHYSTTTASVVKIEQYPTSSSENSRTSYDDNETIAFGPIKVKPRKKPAPTLATGRRSKYEVLSPEEEEKRNIRRARNRAAAERVRVSRLNIEQQLLNQIDELEKQEAQLSENVQNLQHQKLHLETRLFTHEQMCSNMNTSNSSSISQIDLPSYFPSDNISISQQQQYDIIINEKLPDIDFDDLFINSLTTEQIQQNFPDSLSTMLTDDLNDLLMDS